MIYKLLTEIGLSEKESSIYIALLKGGTRSTSFLAGKADLNRGTAYLALHSLVEKGLVTKSTKQKVQYFTALDPSHLLEFLDRQAKEIENNANRINASMGELHALVNPLTTKPKIEFFDGKEGARTVLNYTLSAKNKNLKAFLSIADVIEFVGLEFFDDYTTRRISSGHCLKAIRTAEKDKKAIEKTEHAKRFLSNKEEKREIRYVDENLAFPMTLYLFDNKVAFISSSNENFSVLMESKEFAEMQKKLFDLLWCSSE